MQACPRCTAVEVRGRAGLSAGGRTSRAPGSPRARATATCALVPSCSPTRSLSLCGSQHGRELLPSRWPGPPRSPHPRAPALLQHHALREVVEGVEVLLSHPHGLLLLVRLAAGVGALISQMAVGHRRAARLRQRDARAGPARTHTRARRVQCGRQRAHGALCSESNPPLCVEQASHVASQSRRCYGSVALAMRVTIVASAAPGILFGGRVVHNVDRARRSRGARV